MPFRLGPVELTLIVVIVLLLFGAGRLPQLGEGIGRGFRQFKRAVSGESEQVTGTSDDRPGPAHRQ